MHAFLTKYYRAISTLLLLGIIGLAFYVGTLQAQKGSGGGITLACSDEVLSSLKIPAATPKKSSQIENDDSSISSDNDTAAPSVQGDDSQSSAAPAATSGAFLGSKNGTKYYTPDCAAAKRIKPENVIWFQDAESATLQGYSAASC